jgi:F0F1-type ATP synthase assembly protein I
VSEPDDGLSGLAKAYQNAGPWLSAVWSLIGGPLLGGLVGYGIDKWMVNKGPWAFLTGLMLGIVVGFVGFLVRVTRLSKKDKGPGGKNGA